MGKRTPTGSVFQRTYVDFRMDDWRMGEQSPRMQGVIRQALGELDAEALLLLKDQRLEVMVSEGTHLAAWAFFPIHRRRIVARELHPKPQTRILLVLSPSRFERLSSKELIGYLRDQFGHILLYLRSPRANNDCHEAMKEWRRNRMPVPG
jgi:hypothetical protein